MTVFDWFIKNKEWLFSGVGVVIAAGLFAFIRTKWKRGAAVSSGQQGRTAPQDPSYNPQASAEVGPTDVKVECRVSKRRYILSIGEYCEFSLDSIDKIRVGLLAIVSPDPNERANSVPIYAKVSVSSTAVADPMYGPKVRREAGNYLIPISTGLDDYCVLALYIGLPPWRGAYVRTYRLWVNHINAHKGSAEIDVITLEGAS